MAVQTISQVKSDLLARSKDNCLMVKTDNSAFKVLSDRADGAKNDFSLVCGGANYSKVCTPVMRKDFFSKHIAPVLNEAVEKKGHAKWLDVACGRGHLQSYFANDRRISITGFDIDENSIFLAKKKVPRGNFHTADVADIFGRPNKYDLVTAINAFIYNAHGMALQLSYSLSGKAVINFRDPSNSQFFASSINNGMRLVSAKMIFNGRVFELCAVDLHGTRLPDNSPMRYQFYFPSPGSIESFLSHAGFRIIPPDSAKPSEKHAVYEYEDLFSPARMVHRSLVYTVEKQP